MLGIDTDVLVRLLIADDANQTRRARRLVETSLGRNEPVLVSLLVMIETEWVLRSRYELEKTEILAVLQRLLEARELTFEDEPAIEEALFHWKDSPAGFTDCLIATFDAKAVSVPGFLAAQTEAHNPSTKAGQLQRKRTT
jgi:predicted nucleic-acid-binding protein